MTWKKKGNRIRASDKSLVYHFCIGWLLLLFVAVFLLLNLRQLLVADWKDFNLLHAGITWTAYNSITVLDSDWCLCIGRFSLLPLRI